MLDTTWFTGKLFTFWRFGLFFGFVVANPTTFFQTPESYLWAGNVRILVPRGIR
jgi:hypothetical protein